MKIGDIQNYSTTKATLFKLKSNHNNLRSDEITGYFVRHPSVGESFMLYAEPLDPDADLRVVITSIVQAVDHDGHVMNFETQNSKYRLVLGE